MFFEKAAIFPCDRLSGFDCCVVRYAMKLEEVETDHARVEPDEMMDILILIAKVNLRKGMSMKRLSRKESFQMLPKKILQGRYEATSVNKTNCAPPNTDKRKKFNLLFVIIKG
ncbi:hypothetical protein TNCV_3783531 [Trichonephila clavipes]|nr:hypothetical protein TNCV_3783531 [Trichonephila clavipes]